MGHWLGSPGLSLRRGQIVLRENKVSEPRATATAWMEKREKELAKPYALEDLRANKTDKRNPTLADAIDLYVSESAKAIVFPTHVGMNRRMLAVNRGGTLTPDRRPILTPLS